MRNNAIKTIQFRRKREQKTDYKKRLRYLVSEKPRAVIRKSTNLIIVQIVEYSPGGDLTKVLVNSNAVKKFGWVYSCSNIPAAYLTGLLAGKIALKSGISEIIVDFGRHKVSKGSKLFAAVKGLVDGGMSVNVGEEMLPSNDRLSGKHIALYADHLKNNKDSYTKQFSGYAKAAHPEKITDAFIKIKENIIKQG